MAKIKANNGKEFIVDDSFHTILSQFSWREKSGYAYTTIKGKHISMHRLIAGEVFNKNKNLVIDHINGNKFDNRFQNLLLVNHSINNHKRLLNKKRENIKFIGVVRVGNKYLAAIGKNKKRHSRSFFDAFEAARYYDKKAIEFYGDSAHTNIKFFTEIVEKLSGKI